MTRIVKDLSMTMLRTADVYKFPYPGGGITGFCLIAESHVSIHTWPEKKYFSLDVFPAEASTRKNRADYPRKFCHRPLLRRSRGTGAGH